MARTAYFPLLAAASTGVDMKVRKRLGVAALATLAAVAVVVVAGLPVYVFPYADDVQSADLVYVIGPPAEQRLKAAQRLRDQGVAERILVSVALKGEHSARELKICREPDVICAHPEPFTTAGEAAMLNDYAGANEDVVIITYTPHVARTRFIFERCFDGKTFVDPVRRSLSLTDWGYQYLYQTSGFVKAWVTGCV